MPAFPVLNPQPISVEELPLPDGAATQATLQQVKDLTALAAFSVNDVDAVSESLTYVGCEDKDGVWLVKKISVSGTVTTIRFATAGIIANAAYTNYGDAWDDRATLTYTTFGEAF